MSGGLKGLELVKCYGRRTVVRGASLTVAGGEVVGLLGPNGAGKTTCFAMMAGLTRPAGGRVLLDGIDVTGEPLHRRARRGLCYLPQEPSIFRGLSVLENVTVVLEARGLERRTAVLRAEGLLEELNLLPLRGASAQVLSGGERRRLEFARALALEPRYMLLDEPFTGIDPLGIAELRRLVAGMASRGIGVLLTDHNVGECLKSCERAYLLFEGRILAEGGPEELVVDEQVKAVYLGADFGQG